MEFGPRALGNRSIVANPLDPNARNRINNEIKEDMNFNHFARLFWRRSDKGYSSFFLHKHMATAFRLKEEYREKLDSAIHIDGTARPQFVEEKDNLSFLN